MNYELRYITGQGKLKDLLCYAGIWMFLREPHLGLRISHQSHIKKVNKLGMGAQIKGTM